jgi:hypothetical protein
MTSLIFVWTVRYIRENSTSLISTAICVEKNPCIIDVCVANRNISGGRMNVAENVMYLGNIWAPAIKTPSSVSDISFISCPSSLNLKTVNTF